MLKNDALKKGLKLVWFSTGKEGGLITTSRSTVDLLKKYGTTEPDDAEERRAEERTQARLVQHRKRRRTNHDVAIDGRSLEEVRHCRPIHRESGWTHVDQLAQLSGRVHAAVVQVIHGLGLR